MQPRKEIVAILISRLGAREFRELYDSLCAGGTLPTAEAAISSSSQLASWCSDQALISPIELSVERFLERGGRILSIFDTEYPQQVRQTEYPPSVLFAEGEISCLSSEYLLGVVGSRSADPQSWKFARNICADLARVGVCIVSGMAIGIDSAAHRGALDSAKSKSTIAVLGSGLDHIYPKSNRELFEQILDGGGLVLSQFELEHPPFPANFLNRNRVISGLSSALLVIQASLRSGSLVTARNALEQGRELLVVPGSVFDTRYQGSNKLIKSGAHLVTSVEDVFEILDIAPANIAQHSSNSLNGSGISEIQQKILSLIRERGRLHAVAIQTLIGTQSVNEELLNLELEGRIYSAPGDFWAIRADLQ